MAFNPVSTGASLAVAVNGSTVTTGSWEQHQSDTLRVTCNVDSHVAVGIGSTNAAAAGSVFIKGGETVNINRKAMHLKYIEFIRVQLICTVTQGCNRLSMHAANSKSGCTLLKRLFLS